MTEHNRRTKGKRKPGRSEESQTPASSPKKKQRAMASTKATQEREPIKLFTENCGTVSKKNRKQVRG